MNNKHLLQRTIRESIPVEGEKGTYWNRKQKALIRLKKPEIRTLLYNLPEGKRKSKVIINKEAFQK